MGRSVNKVTLIGTLGRDPEVRYMPNGNAVANMTMATDESYNDKQTGQKVEQTEWHRLTVYGKLAEICQQYLKKGSRAYFEGRLRTREWEKDGVKRYTTEIICNDMMMLTPRTDQPQSGGQNGYGQQPQQPRQSAQQPQRPPYNPVATPPPANQPQGAYLHDQPSQGGYQHPANNFDDFDDDIPF
ncbi:single-stranded DNA-binding protein [Oceanobacter sp. 3_MG-2023]|uniref:single-stranded DNA-binding protein n=1 Tax=Oceanobacter sp. 3_MG-2023 TaxID=3062622 RepID=UPI002732ACFB|nr:single-stranded DNA-binding protein [Oceanobacter sp. 3_MG-2023]MDP2505402.1 single-stranded DNA-binding protein [Oceanobacter sp. 3_MG-2023]